VSALGARPRSSTRIEEPSSVVGPLPKNIDTADSVTTSIALHSIRAVFYSSLICACRSFNSKGWADDKVKIAYRDPAELFG
jgi:hypothetical protein